MTGMPPAASADEHWARATVLAAQARYDEAERQFREALAMFEAAESPDSAKIGAVAHELAATLFATGRIDEAASLYERAASVKRAVLGPAHPDVALTLHNWALLCDATGQHDRARRLWAEAGIALESTERDGNAP